MYRAQFGPTFKALTSLGAAPNSACCTSTTRTCLSGTTRLWHWFILTIRAPLLPFGVLKIGGDSISLKRWCDDSRSSLSGEPSLRLRITHLPLLAVSYQ